MKKITITIIVIIAIFVILGILGFGVLYSFLSNNSALNQICEKDAECEISFSYAIKALIYVPKCVEGKCAAISYIYEGCSNDNDCNCSKSFEIAGDIDINTPCSCLDNWCTVIN